MSPRSTFSQDRAKAVIDGLSDGRPLTVIASEIGVCDDTVRNWADADPDFARDITHARARGFDKIAFDALEIADNAAGDYVETESGAAYNAEHVQRSKLRVETRLKLLAKWDPKRYGDKQQHEHSGTIGLAEMVLAAQREREGKG